MKMEDKEEPAVAFTVTVDRDEGQKREKIVFPPPSTWYRSSVAAARDDMWAYASSNMIVLVKNCVEEQKVTENETNPDVVQDGQNANVERLAEQKSRSKTSRKWPTFTMVGEQTNKKYNCVSFCQSSWDYLPVPGAPLVSGCEGGFVRVWNLEQNAAVIYHDNHSSQQVTGLDWSLRDPSIIYSIDDAGTMTVWNVKQNTLRSLNFGKVVPTSLQACPQLDNVVSFGTKGGNVFIVETGGNGKILAKVRHDEEVVVTAWKPIGDWFTLESYKCDTKGPVVVSSTHAMKLPTIRVWNSNGQDLGTLQAWEKDPKQRAFKIFGPAAWGRDPHSGSLVLFSSARHGEIISWTSSRVHDIVHTVHGHNAIFAMVQCGDILWTMSYEPIIVGWNLRTSQIECIVPTFKGACTVAASPIDNSRLAIGGTDSVIRVLKCSDGYPSEGDGCAIAPLNSNKLKGKITAIAWHPGKDNCLGLGTDEGVLGIFELKENNRHAMMFDRRVNGTVYTVNFGPSVYHADYKVPKQEQPVSSEESDKSGGNAEKVTDKERFMLYACGGSAVYMIHPSRPSNPLLSVSKIIEKSNPDESKECTSADYRQLYKASDIRWSPDFSYLAVGYVDGRIELYSAPNLKIKCWIKCHLRAIQYLSWRPFDFCTKSEAEKTNDRWLASTSNDGTTRLYNLKELFEKEIQESETSEPSMIISSEATFQGHGVRVISCAWSPHDKNLLVTVAYDSTAIVWNMEDGSHLARYMGHEHRLVACCFHPTDKFKLITISDEQSRDFAIHVWDYREHPFRKNLPRSRPAGMAVPVKASCEIGMKVGTGIDNEGKSKDVVVVKNQGEIHTIKKAVDATEEKGKGKYSKQKPKPLMPLTSNVLINGKHNQLSNELRFIVDKVPLPSVELGLESTSNENTVLLEDPAIHLGILGSRNDCIKQLKLERNGQKDKSLDNCAILSKWFDDTKWLEDAIKNGEVTESMLAIAASVNRVLYLKAMIAFAKKLVQNEEYVKAANYYYLAGTVDEAVKVLVDHNLYREAVAVLKSTGCESDPRIVEVMNKWVAKLVVDGNYELAVKIACSMGQYLSALQIIEKRAFPYAYKAGCFISSKLNEVKKMEMFGVKFVLDAIPRGAYDECTELINDHPELNWLKSIWRTHKALTGYAKYVGEISEMKDYQMWEMVLSSLLDASKTELLSSCEPLGAEALYSKISSNILVSIAQTEIDAQQIISKNITVLMLYGITSLTEMDATTKALETVKLAKTWLAVKNPALYFAVVMTTTALIPAWKYPAQETVPVEFGACQHDAVLGILNSVSIKLMEQLNDKEIPLSPEQRTKAIEKLGTIAALGVACSGSPFEEAKKYMEFHKIPETLNKIGQACWTSFKEVELNMTGTVLTFCEKLFVPSDDALQPEKSDDIFVTGDNNSVPSA